MKNKLVFLVCTIVLALITLLSCDKDKVPEEPTPCTTCQSVTEAKDYFAFKVGSWWVYEEETSLERDSVYVTESFIDQSGYDFNIRMFSTYQNYYYHYWPTYLSNLNGCNQSSPVSKRCLFVNRSKYQFGNVLGENYCFFVNYKSGDYETEFNVCLPENKIIISEIFSLYDLGLFNLGKTIKIHELCTFIENCQPTNHYFSKGVGLVRKELIDSNKVWNLVNYHIEP